MNKQRFLLALAAAVYLAAPSFAQSFRPYEPLNPAKAQSLPLTPLSIESDGKTHDFQVEVAATERERDTGLMHRAELGPDRGMLFIYRAPRVMKFWMRNTFVPLDMIFMRSDGTITMILSDVQPHDERPVGPDRPVSAQLELPAGTAARLGLRRGDVVRHAAFRNLTASAPK